ncbi:MAG: hypothetical protein RLY86_12 [Pseudomonadota bacterium]|jgi:protease YdgD
MGIGAFGARELRWIGACLLACLSAAPAAARSDRPSLPGIDRPGWDGDDRRVVDVSIPPWNAVVKVQTRTGGRCSGSLIGPRLVLTAAHCLWNPRTRRQLPPESLHVLAGYARGEMRGHAGVVGYRSGLDGGEEPTGAALFRDWAVLILDGGLDGVAGVGRLGLLDRPVTPDDTLAAAGFSQDRAHLLMADTDCRLSAGDSSGLLLHDCALTRGVSGGPLLVRIGAGWALAGIVVAAGSGGNLALALSALPSGSLAAAP